jgi:hypothetical protein
MKRVILPLLIILAASVTISSCKSGKAPKEPNQVASDTLTAADTGYTGIKQYMSNKTLVKEVTFKNGVREGLMKSFYQTGQLRQTFWYKNGLREDSAKWFYIEGQLFRSTPYIHDTVDGIQKQYYRNGRLKARIGYSKGLRTPYIEEFTPEGKLVKGYPQLVVETKDEYSTKGTYRIILSLTEKSREPRFFRGDVSKEVFDTAHCTKIKIIDGKGYLDLKKSNSPTSGSVGVIASSLTGFGNNYLILKKIDLPYNDLK